jgi:hypothetical protein
MNRFSVRWLVIITILHIIGTILLFDAGFEEVRAMKQAMVTGQPEPSFLWLQILSWIWYPVPRLVAQFVRPIGPSQFFYLTLLWSVGLGVCFGFFMPRLLRWNAKSPNQSLEPTTGRRDVHI